MDMDKKEDKKKRKIGDKQQITAIGCGSLSGDVLSFSLIYQGKHLPNQFSKIGF